MTVYIRAYHDYCYEFIFTEGNFRKKSRLHILINPNNEIRLLAGDEETAELNSDSLTHIFSVETSIIDEQILIRTARLAEKTNKPIITNKKSSVKLKELGLSTRQLRLLGFEEEVIDGLSIDPVYSAELDDEEQKIEEKKIIQNPITSLSKFGKKITKFVIPKKENKDKKDIKIDSTNPIAVVISINTKRQILIPLDSRGVKIIDKIISNVEPWLVILPNQPISNTFTTKKDTNLLFITENYNAEHMLTAAASSNFGLTHETYIAGYLQWYEIPS